MNLHSLVSTALCCVLISGLASAQNRIGEWKEYLNYSRSLNLAVVDDRVYVAADNTVFIYDQADNSMTRLSRVNGLSDVGISLIRATPDGSSVILGYTNGNIDVITGNAIENFAAIKNSTVVGDKEIRHVSFSDSAAFISTGVGILRFDLSRLEIRDTYEVVPAGNLSINETAVLNDTLYAASDEGLYYGSLSTDLTIFSNWMSELSIPDPFGVVGNCANQNGQLYINQPQLESDPGLYRRTGIDTWIATVGNGDINFLRESAQALAVATGYYGMLLNNAGTEPELTINDYNGSGVNVRAMSLDENGVIWIADARRGLVKRNTNGSFEFIHPDGPASNLAFDLDFYDGELWVATGNPERPGTWNNSYLTEGFYRLRNDRWRNYTRNTDPIIFDELFFDACKVYIDPIDRTKVYVGSYYRGLMELENEEIAELYDVSNSTLEDWAEFGVEDEWVGVAGIAKDNDNNLWVSNSFADEPLSVQTPDGTWKSFNLGGANGLGNNRQLLNLIIDQNGYKWTIVNRGGIIVFDEGESIESDEDNRVNFLTAASGSGNLPSNDVTSLTEDLNGEIWVGTTQGIAVFYSPFDILSDNPSDSRQILVEQNGVFQFLLDGQTVSGVAVDGANRKWISTFGAGVFLMSANGTEEIARFTSENSPLLSNIVNDVVIDDATGEVFFATSEGIVSYFSDATSGSLTNQCTSVYPNPVRESYEGLISIDGLVRDSEIRITDVRGNLIYSTVSNGGKATWNGRNTNGERVVTGVYFALSSDDQGETTCVSKILVVK
ncbi:MAG: two-component regulator propeller domain-containing protein [Cryomorphaceae bacterium]|nr:T9SS type A sorting domain-containing protein [Flavobacteriales bacterium]